MPRLVAYARVSTIDQNYGLEAQIEALTVAGADVIFNEKVSALGGRPEFEAALADLQPGDTLVVTKLDRLARSIRHLCEIVDLVEAKKASLRILAMNLDTSTPTGRLMLNLLGSVAQFEREIMLERQRDGIAKARAEGKYVGRQPTALRRSAQVLEMHGAGASNRRIAREMGIGRASVYRILRLHGAADDHLVVRERRRRVSSWDRPPQEIRAAI